MSPIQTFYTVPAGSPIKSVQRGSAAGAGNVTITSIDINKAFVNIFGTTSSGNVSSSFNISANSGNFNLLGTGRWSSTGSTSGSSYNVRPSTSTANQSATYSGSHPTKFWNATTTVNAGNFTVGSGSNNLVAAVVQGYLSNSTTLVVSGACRWEVVEFN